MSPQKLSRQDGTASKALINFSFLLRKWFWMCRSLIFLEDDGSKKMLTNVAMIIFYTHILQKSWYKQILSYIEKFNWYIYVQKDRKNLHLFHLIHFHQLCLLEWWMFSFSLMFTWKHKALTSPFQNSILRQKLKMIHSGKWYFLTNYSLYFPLLWATPDSSCV